MTHDLTHNWNIVGHKAQLKLIEKAIETNNLAHAYIFSGPNQIGKKTVAKRLAQLLLCETNSACDNCIHCRTFAVGSNADYISLFDEESLKIESIRDLSYKLSLRPYAGKYKVAIIDNAHDMTTEAANALLKVLEEPKSHTIMILITDNVYRLLPTISSRAQKINFGPLSDEIFSEWLKSLSIETQDPSFAGKPGYVLKLKDGDHAVNVEEYSNFLNDFISGSLGKKLLVASEIAEKETLEIGDVFDHWLHHLRKNLRENPSLQIVNKIRGLIRAQRLLGQNVNSKLLLTELMVTT